MDSATCGVNCPLPSNLANNKNKQATKQARQLSVLAVTPSQHPGGLPHLAILYLRWCPCQIQFLSHQLTGGTPGRGHQVGRCPPKTAYFVPQNTFSFGPQRPQNPFKMDKRRETGATFHVHLDFIVTKSPFLPSNSTICPRNGQTMAKKTAKDVHSLCQIAPKPRNGRILGYMAQIRNLRPPSPPATPPLFVVSKPQIRPTRRLDPHSSGHLVEPDWEHGSRTVGANGGRVHQGPRGKRKDFCQSCS